MKPMPLTRPERSALKKLVRLNGSCDRRRLSADNSRRFIQLGLLLDFRGEYHLTLRGQIEVLRQRYRRMPARPRPVKVTRTMLDDRLFRKSA